MKPTIQFNPLQYPIYVLSKPVGTACNLRCAYCYYLDKKELHAKQDQTRMTDTLLEKFISQYILAQPGPQVLFTWHGGEPLLLGIDYFKKALFFQQKYGSGRSIDNSLQTNATLLTDEWCQFFKANKFLIGVSLDGPQHCHDHYRKNAAGEGSFSSVLKGIELLQKYDVDFNILSVVNNYNVQFPLEIYRFFKSIGAQFIQFSPVVERTGACTQHLISSSEQGDITPWSVSSVDYGKFLCAIFDEWVRKDVGNVFVTTFDNTLAGYVGEENATCIFSKTCGHAAALDFNGDLYSCDHFVFPQYKLGNINQSTITEMMLSKAQTQFGNAKKEQLPDSCLQCQYLHLCHGECPKNRIVSIPEEKYPGNYLCEGLKYYFNHTESYMKYMATELMHDRAPANVMTLFG